MSLTRQLLHDIRPLFRLLEEPFGRSPAFLPYSRTRSLLDDPFFHSPAALRPAVDVTEEGNNYIVEAELPGVKKENVEVRIGDGGRSVTIEGRIVNRRAGGQEGQTAASEAATETASAATNGDSTAIAQAPQQNEISTERSFAGSSTFTRTVWLPRQVDSNNVSAKLDDGILTVTIAKAEDPASVSIPVQ
ncbi:HSP20-like chaperone [Cristinia sonorae]|uniref:HSP20-like chaperone n=1 Tax=Cristinia sonorae TaxID=1940300 RepID=A0A8K0XTE6_9AGAR|nr:HSP20-like chaperone [Cristinia sonorae]